MGRENCLFIHVTFIPYIVGSGEYKSKPTQHSVKELRSLGIFPNIIVARCDQPIPDSIRQKISMSVSYTHLDVYKRQVYLMREILK